MCKKPHLTKLREEIIIIAACSPSTQDNYYKQYLRYKYCIYLWYTGIYGQVYTHF